jgi:hypothetical protein
MMFLLVCLLALVFLGWCGGAVLLGLEDGPHNAQSEGRSRIEIAVRWNPLYRATVWAMSPPEKRS